MKLKGSYLHAKANNTLIFVRDPCEHHIWKAWRVEFDVDPRWETAEETFGKILIFLWILSFSTKGTKWTINVLLSVFWRWHFSF